MRLELLFNFSNCVLFLQGDGKTMEDLRLKKESESRHCIHWQGCPNYKGLYGEGGELNVVS